MIQVQSPVVLLSLLFYVNLFCPARYSLSFSTLLWPRGGDSADEDLAGNNDSNVTEYSVYTWSTEGNYEGILELHVGFHRIFSTSLYYVMKDFLNSS